MKDVPVDAWFAGIIITAAAVATLLGCDAPDTADVAAPIPPPTSTEAVASASTSQSAPAAPRARDIPATLHGMPVSNENQLALLAMSDSERKHVTDVLNRITAITTRQQVADLLGPPSRNVLGGKLNWWVNLGGHQDRIGVYFSGDRTTRVVLDGGTGRFYYRVNFHD